MTDDTRAQPRSRPAFRFHEPHPGRARDLDAGDSRRDRPRDPGAEQGRRGARPGRDRRPGRRPGPTAGLGDPRDRGRPRSRSASSTSPSTATTSACGPRPPRSTRPGSTSTYGATVVLVDDVLFTGRTIRAGPGRPDRFRAAPASPARRAGGPGSPGASHPCRLRGQERARPPGRRTVRVLLEEIDGQDAVEVGEPSDDRAPAVARRGCRRTDIVRDPGHGRVASARSAPGSSRRCRPCGAAPW